MNDIITVALKKAGVKMPHPRERVWNFIKDEPGASHASIRAVLNLSESAASQACLSLHAAGMIEATSIRVRGAGGRSSPSKAYTCHPKFPVYVDGPKTAAGASGVRTIKPPKPTDPIVIVANDTVDIKLPTTLVTELQAVCCSLEVLWGFKPTLVQAVAFVAKCYKSSRGVV